MTEIEEAEISLKGFSEYLEAQIQNAMNFLGLRKDQSERERLMTDLDAFLSTEANRVQMEAINWLNKLKYRMRELEKQSSLIHALASSSTPTSVPDTDTNSYLCR